MISRTLFLSRYTARCTRRWSAAGGSLTPSISAAARTALIAGSWAGVIGSAWRHSRAVSRQQRRRRDRIASAFAAAHEFRFLAQSGASRQRSTSVVSERSRTLETSGMLTAIRLTGWCLCWDRRSSGLDVRFHESGRLRKILHDVAAL